jgi:hypothetical protein
LREPAIGPVVTVSGRAAVFDWTVMDPSLLRHGHLAEGRGAFAKAPVPTPA